MVDVGMVSLGLERLGYTTVSYPDGQDVAQRTLPQNVWLCEALASKGPLVLPERWGWDVRLAAHALCRHALVNRKWSARHSELAELLFAVRSDDAADPRAVSDAASLLQVAAAAGFVAVDDSWDELASRFAQPAEGPELLSASNVRMLAYVCESSGGVLPVDMLLCEVENDRVDRSMLSVWRGAVTSLLPLVVACCDDPTRLWLWLHGCAGVAGGLPAERLAALHPDGVAPSSAWLPLSRLQSTLLTLDDPSPLIEASYVSWVRDVLRAGRPVGTLVPAAVGRVAEWSAFTSLWGSWSGTWGELAATTARLSDPALA